MLDPLDFLAEFTQHIPPKGAHLIRYYGWYSNKSRGMRRKAAEAAEQPGAASSSEASETAAPSRCSQTWAMLIKRVYEIDPLACPRCGGQMKVVALIEPPQGAGNREDSPPLRAMESVDAARPAVGRRLGL